MMTRKSYLNDKLIKLERDRNRLVTQLNKIEIEIAKTERRRDELIMRDEQHETE